MTKRHDELMRQTKEELIKHIIELEKAAAKGDLTERDVHLQSAAGQWHTFSGLVDDGQGPIVIRNLPEDELGFWHPYYELDVNGQNLGHPRIIPRDAYGK